MSRSFPRDADDLTTGWLSEALGRDVGAVRRTRIGAERGNLGAIIRLDMGNVEVPIVAKFGSTRPEDLAAAKRSGLYEREVRFYTHLAPSLGVRVPDCSGAFYDADTGHCLLLLEFLDSPDELDTIEGIGPERTAQVLSELAVLHAGGVAADHDWLQTMLFEGRIHNLRLMIERGWPRLVALCPDIVDPAIGIDLGDRLEALMRSMAELDQVIVHGDVKPDNLQVSGNRVALLDWQAVGLGPPAWDVAYAMVNCLTTADRRAHEGQLLSDYPNNLDGYGPAMLFPLVVATALTVMGDPDEPRRVRLVRTTAERAVAAMTDHGLL